MTYQDADQLTNFPISQESAVCLGDLSASVVSVHSVPMWLFEEGGGAGGDVARSRDAG